MEEKKFNKQEYKCREYSCKTCEKLLKLKSKFNMHELVHGGEKPDECDICKKCFVQSLT